MNEQITTIKERSEQLVEYPHLMIFDMDKTIVLEDEFYKQTFSRTLNETVFEERGQEGLETLKYYRTNFEGKGELALSALGIPFRKWAAKLIAAPLDGITPQPEVVEKVRKIPTQKVVFTGSPRELAIRILTRFGFDPEKDFDAIIGWKEPELSPLKWNCSPFVFQAICQKFGVNPQDAWSIGDNWESDLLPAKTLGITTIQVNKTAGTPDFWFPTISALIENVERSKSKPYVVSGDIRLALQRWANDKGFVLPNDEVFETLRSRFTQIMQNIFPNFEFVPEEELVEGAKKIVDTNLPTISLDGNYYPSQYQVDITRLVDTEYNDKGLGRRNGSPLLLMQFRLLDQLVESGKKEVNIFDDVGFSGDLLLRIIDTLQQRGLTVKNVYLGIGTGESVRKLQKRGFQVQCVRQYNDLLDEICERDFYPGVPQSGRSLPASEVNQGIPYLLPFGKPDTWASIPSEYTVAFSKFCIDQSIELFTAIENSSGKIVRCCDLERLPVGIPNDTSRFVDKLIEIQNTL